MYSKLINKLIKFIVIINVFVCEWSDNLNRRTSTVSEAVWYNGQRETDPCVNAHTHLNKLSTRTRHRDSSYSVSRLLRILFFWNGTGNFENVIIGVFNTSIYGL